MKYVIFGADKLGIDFYYRMKEKQELVAFIDNDPEKQGKEIVGIKVMTPEKLMCLDFEKIQIASLYHYGEIAEQVKQLGISDNKIFFEPVENYQYQENSRKNLCLFQNIYNESVYEDTWKDVVDKYKSIQVFCLGVAAIGELIARFSIIHNTCGENDILRIYIPDMEEGNRICNKYLIKYLGRKIHLIQEDKANFWSYILKYHDREVDFSEFLKYRLRKNFPVYQVCENSEVNWFTDEENQEGKKILEQIGATEPYVCIGARTNAYNKKTLGYEYDYDYRNMNFDDYKPAINYLGEQNVKTIKMGRMEAPMKEIYNCIDYAGLHADDFGDLYIASKCLFFIVNCTGMFTLASLFARPLLMVNAVPISFGMGGVQYTDKDLYIPKKYYDINKKRYLSLREIIQIDRQCSIWGKKYEEKGIRFIDNTPEEIASAAKEMLERVTGRWMDTTEDMDNYNRYKDIYNEMRIAAAKNPDNWTGEPLPYRISAVHLRNNSYLLK